MSYSAVESKSEISIRQIHKPSARRVKYEKIVQGIGKFDSDDSVNGPVCGASTIENRVA